MEATPAAIVAAVLTVSDGVTHGTRADESGDVAEAMLAAAGFDVTAREVVPDERSAIEEALRRLASAHRLVVTTGGTGFGPRDVTPEATRAVLERDAPGLGELMRSAGLGQTPMAALSRAVAGALGGALVINLPGSPSGVRESLQAVLPVVPHAVELLGGGAGEHPTGHERRSPRGRVEAKAVKIVSGAPPCRVGSSMSIEPGGPVHGTLGCAEFDAAAGEAAAQVAETGEPDTRVFHHDLGDIEVYLEPTRPVRKLVVVSATDVARALRAFLSALGYDAVTVESRPARVTPADGPTVASVDDVELGPGDAVVLTDHDAPDVPAVLASALRSPAGFVGLMGSRRHVAHRLEDLRAAGVDEADIARVRTPLGLDLGGRRPEEIALSIAAGIVAHVHGRDGGWLDR
jgi:molybdopterin adenylyltransferase